MVNIKAILAGAVQMGASDIHLAQDSPPFFRIRGDLKRVDTPALTAEDIEAVLAKTFPEWLRPSLETDRGCDFAYEHPNIGRFRGTAFYTDEKVALSFRLIPLEAPSFDTLGMPEILKTIALYPRGMVLVTGITGCGKSTTLAAMIDHLNRVDARRVITIEDPVEFRYKNRKCMISQREVGNDVGSFSLALRQALRSDPDVILVGEMRDAETIQIAIKSAETGHLVFSTLHTTGAIHTIERIIGHFDQREHALLIEQLSLNLRATLTQRLVKTIDAKNRCAAVEILIVNQVVAKLLNENRIADIQGVIASRDDGMQTMDQALADLVKQRRTSIEEASRFCVDYYALRRYVSGAGSSGDRGGILTGA